MTMDINGYIDVTAAPLATLIGKAYERSSPQGMGHLHFQAGGLTGEEIEKLIAAGGTRAFGSKGNIDLDYVHGRAVKLNIITHEGRRYIWNDWFDHNDAQLAGLLSDVGLGFELIGKARAVKEQWDDECVEMAVAWLKSQGGKAVTAQREEVAYPVLHGLHQGVYTKPPRINSKWNMNDYSTAWELTGE